MKIIAIAKGNKKMFYSIEEASEFFGIKAEQLNKAMSEDHPVVHKGVEYYLDEVIEGALHED